MDFAAYGQLEELEEYLDAEPELVNYVDEENGWQVRCRVESTLFVIFLSRLIRLNNDCVLF